MGTDDNLFHTFPLVNVVEQSDFRVFVTVNIAKKSLRSSILERQDLMDDHAGSAH